MRRLLSETGERGFIEALRKNFPMALAGDDAAVLESLFTPVVTTDSFMEGTHFHRWWTTPEAAAERLLEATLSDLAAMGADPRYLFSSVILPPDMELKWILDFYKGLTGREDCPVAGGETISGGTFTLTLTAIGECGKNTPFRRSSAKPGDSLWVTGPLGRSFNSPELLEKGRRVTLTESERTQTELFLNPRARFDAVPLLRNAGSVTAIDISDGLFSECAHIARESGVGMTLDLDRVPLVDYCSERPLDACSAGEDFELLFTLPSEEQITGFYRIGSVTSCGGIETISKGQAISLSEYGYDHFYKGKR